MNDEGHSNNPTARADSDTLPDAPHQDAQPKRKVSKDGENGTEGDKKATNVLTRELHWVEGFQPVFSAILVIVGIIALIVYSKQLDAMRSQSATMEQTLETMFIQTKAMQSQLAQTDKLIASGNISANAARSAAGTAAKSLEVSDRAWLMVDVAITAPLTYSSKDGVRMGFTFTLNNIGRSPAETVHVSPELVMVAAIISNPQEREKKLCEGSAKFKLDSYVVFPGEPHRQGYSLGISIEDMDAINGHTEKAIGHKIDPVLMEIIGCIDYTFRSSPKHHQTGFDYQIRTRENLAPAISQTPIAPERLMLMETPYGSYFAN